MGFPKQLSGRRPKLPQQPWQPRAVARARSVILALGSGPSGFPKHFGAGEWPDGATQSGGILGAAAGDVVSSLCRNMGGPDRQVPRQPSKVTGQPMAVLSTMAEDPASGRNGRFILQKRLYGQICRFRLRMADFTLSRTSSLSTARSARARRVPFFATRRIIKGLGLGLARRAARKLVPVVLTLGSGPSGFPRKLSARRPKLPRQPWQTRAVVRARSVIVALGAGASGFPTQLRGDGRSFRDSHGKPAPSFARAPLFWRWGLSRNNFPGDGQSICDSVPRARFRRFSAGEWPDGLPETSFRATQASATAMANPRRRSRALR